MPVYRAPYADSGGYRPRHGDQIPGDVAVNTHSDATSGVVEIHASDEIPVYEDDDDVERLAVSDSEYSTLPTPTVDEPPTDDDDGEDEDDDDGFICDDCGATFDSPQALNGHKSSH